MAERKQITTKEYLAEVKGGLENELNLNAKALPENFNQSRFVLNCISLIKSNLSNYNNITPESVYLALAKGAYLGLDFFNGECYAMADIREKVGFSKEMVEGELQRRLFKCLSEQ